MAAYIASTLCDKGRQIARLLAEGMRLCLCNVADTIDAEMLYDHASSLVTIMSAFGLQLSPTDLPKTAVVTPIAS